MTGTLNTFGRDNRPVCILGLGLIGGSLLRDLTAQGWTVFGWNRSAGPADAARSEGFDASTDLVGTLRRAADTDALVVLAVPVPALDGLLAHLAEHAPDCGFTDVTSVKAQVLDLVAAHGMSHRFVGGHPMAGTADSGWAATVDGLFTGCVWVVTYDNAPVEDVPVEDESPLYPTNPRAAEYEYILRDVSPEAPQAAAGNGTSNPYSTRRDAERQWLDVWRRVVRMASAVGAVVVPARARKHDHAVARVSHLPHVLAEALAVTGDQGGALTLSLAASSFRDGTRVAGTDPALVRAMCENNREALAGVLDEAIQLLTAAREDIASPDRDIRVLAEAGHSSRLRFEARAGRTPGEPSNRPIIRVRPGAPGWLDQLRYAESIGAQIGVF
ncbi:prephenate dehydrogenase [Corynebacterium bovis]|uniref:prephenate dehydrogenase n=2 Tax=Corynebacterium bovis TaxID=36808 RepID=UPI00313A2426